MKLLIALLLLISGAASAQQVTALGSMASQSAGTVAISGGTISGVVLSNVTGLPQTLFAQTANQTIGSASDVSCYSATGVGSQTIAANAAYVGETFELSCRGGYTTPLANVATVTAKVKWGATTIASVTTISLPASAANFPFGIDVVCTVRTTGASGSIICMGPLSYATALSSVSPLQSWLQNASPVTIDTTTASKLDITLAWSTIAGSQTAMSATGLLQLLW